MTLKRAKITEKFGFSVDKLPVKTKRLREILKELWQE
jgi:hypothetical protein